MHRQTKMMATVSSKKLSPLRKKLIRHLVRHQLQLASTPEIVHILQLLQLSAHDMFHRTNGMVFAACKWTLGLLATFLGC